jgi:hypothetical protein
MLAQNSGDNALYDIEAEENILGSILLDSEPTGHQPIALLAPVLPPEAFSHTAHQIVYRTALQLYKEQGKPTDLITVRSTLRDNNQLEKIGGVSALARFVDRCVGSQLVLYHANLVLEKYYRRQLTRVGQQLIDLGSDARETETVLALAKSKVFALPDPAAKAKKQFKLEQRALLPLEEIYHPTLAKPLKLLAKVFPVPEELIAHTLMPIVASLVHPDSFLLVRKATNHVERPILRSVTIAESSNRKSAFESLLLAALKRLQIEALEEFQLKSTAWEEENAAWERLSQKEKENCPNRKPGSKPKRRLYVFQSGTKEGLWDVLEEQPNHGILHAPDELLQVVTSRGEYSKGKSSDKEDSLSGFNGGVRTILRKGQVKNFRDNASLLGGIQPAVLPALVNDSEDSRGELARYLPYFFPLQKFPFPKDDLDLDLEDFLLALYRKLDSLPAQTYRLSKKARELYGCWYNELEDSKGRVLPADRAFIGKLEGYCAKLALLLHLLWEVSEGQLPPSPEIPPERMVAAIKFSNFYYSQAQRLRQPEDGSEIKAKIVERLRLLGTICPSDLTSGSRQLKALNRQELISHMVQLALASPELIKKEEKRGTVYLTLVSTDAPVSLRQTENLPTESKDRTTLDGGVQSLNPYSARLSDEGWTFDGDREIDLDPLVRVPGEPGVPGTPAGVNNETPASDPGAPAGASNETPVGAPGAPAGASNETPAKVNTRPQISLSKVDALTLLKLAQDLSPNIQAVQYLFVVAEALVTDELSGKFWEDFSLACAQEIEIPASLPTDFRAFPSLNRHASEEERRKEAQRIAKSLETAKTFKELVSTIHWINPPDQLDWIGRNLATKDVRHSIWRIVRDWCTKRLNPQLDLF